MATLSKEMCEAAPRGSWLNPIHVTDDLTKLEYPAEFKDRSYIYAVPPMGAVTKWYRSYEDYCD